MKLFSREPEYVVVGDGTVATHIPFEVRDLLRHAYPSGDYSETSTHRALIEAARTEDHTYEVAGELRHVAGLVPMIAGPPDGDNCDTIHVARYLVPPPPGLFEAVRSRQIQPSQIHLEYVLLGFLQISMLGPYASYLRAAGPTPHPATPRELGDAEGKVRTALEHTGIELLPWSVLNARVDGVAPVRIQKRLYVPTVHLCLFRRLT